MKVFALIFLCIWSFMKSFCSTLTLDSVEEVRVGLGDKIERGKESKQNGHFEIAHKETLFPKLLRDKSLPCMFRLCTSLEASRGRTESP